MYRWLRWHGIHQRPSDLSDAGQVLRSFHRRVLCQLRGKCAKLGPPFLQCHRGDLFVPLIKSQIKLYWNGELTILSYQKYPTILRRGKYFQSIGGSIGGRDYQAWDSNPLKRARYQNDHEALLVVWTKLAPRSTLQAKSKLSRGRGRSSSQVSPVALIGQEV